jgi:adenine phosphoribosyltransferase
VLGKIISQEYTLEYGRDCLEMHVGGVEHGERALVVDDLIATGGTLCAAMDLLGKFLGSGLLVVAASRSYIQ